MEKLATPIAVMGVAAGLAAAEAPTAFAEDSNHNPNHVAMEAGFNNQNESVLGSMSLRASRNPDGKIVFAHAASEGSNGNNLVCGGVPTKRALMRLARGAADKCGHRDIDESWARLGITEEVAATMHKGKICSDEGMTSQGRRHSPRPGLDRRVVSGGGVHYERPLSAWGRACYDAWVGYREDGTKVGVIMNCGNGEGRVITVPKRRAPVDVVKIAEDADGHRITPTPTGTFQFEASCKSGTRNIHTTAIYYRSAVQRLLKGCNVGSVATVKELPTLGSEEWEMLSPEVQKQIVKKRGNTFVFKDREKAPQTPPSNTVIICSNVNSPNSEACTPPKEQPKPHSCSTSFVESKEPVRQVTMTIGGDSGSREDITWGDNSTSTSTETQAKHTYNNDGTYHVSVHETFADGGTADCGGDVTVKQESAPSAPPA